MERNLARLLSESALLEPANPFQKHLFSRPRKSVVSDSPSASLPPEADPAPPKLRKQDQTSLTNRNGPAGQDMSFLLSSTTPNTPQEHPNPQGRPWHYLQHSLMSMAGKRHDGATSQPGQDRANKENATSEGNTMMSSVQRASRAWEEPKADRHQAKADRGSPKADGDRLNAGRDQHAIDRDKRSIDAVLDVVVASIREVGHFVAEEIEANVLSDGEIGELFQALKVFGKVTMEQCRQFQKHPHFLKGAGAKSATTTSRESGMGKCDNTGSQQAPPDGPAEASRGRVPRVSQGKKPTRVVSVYEAVLEEQKMKAARSRSRLR